MRGRYTEDENVMLRIAVSLVAMVLAISAHAQELSESELAAIKERISPAGEVCLQGDNNCGGAVAVASSGPRSGEAVYNAACMACHSSGAAGAPKYADAGAWAERIAKGMDTLYASGINGIAGTGMIAKGGCMDCSDEEIKAAVDYMVAGSQ